jgi:hypothetical protein
MKMNLKISENTSIRTIETLINEAKSLGLRVVHRPDSMKSNVVSMREAADQRRQQMCVSPEAA